MNELTVSMRCLRHKMKFWFGRPKISSTNLTQKTSSTSTYWAHAPTRICWPLSTSRCNVWTRSPQWDQPCNKWWRCWRGCVATLVRLVQAWDWAVTWVAACTMEPIRPPPRVNDPSEDEFAHLNLYIWNLQGEPLIISKNLGSHWIGYSR